jgi:hypothetical protein
LQLTARQRASQVTLFPSAWMLIAPQLKASVMRLVVETKKLREPTMVYKTHPDIVEAAKAKRSDFTAVAEKHGSNADAIWEDLDDPHSMLDMFEESNYASQHFEALVKFGRWLRNEEQKTDRHATDFDQELSYKEAKIKAETARVASSNQSINEELNERLRDSVLYSMRRSIDSLIASAKRDRIWSAVISASDEEKNQTDLPDATIEIRQRISRKLRELIPAPFLPVI